MNSRFRSKGALIPFFLFLTVLLSQPMAQTTDAPYRIHCGGDAIRDSEGNWWEADGHFTGGATYSTVEDIANTANMDLYKTERWLDPGLGGLDYSFDVAEGDYTVRLHFAEIYVDAFLDGGRVFDVAINGAKVLEGFDIFKEVGANTALIKEFTATAVDGKISIELSNQIGNAKISGIEILGSSKPRATAPPYRIMAGALNDYTDQDGNFWEADGHYTGGSTYWPAAGTVSTSLPMVYQQERWNNPNLEPLVYSFDAPEGNYLVRLHFAEIVYTTPSTRVFDVLINDELVIQSLDLADSYGFGISTFKEFTVASVGGAIKISFNNVIENAKISGIEILPAEPTIVKKSLPESANLTAKTNGSTLSILAPFEGGFSLNLRNTAGVSLARKSSRGTGEQVFTGLRPGVYFIEAKTSKTTLMKKVCLLP